VRVARLPKIAVLSSGDEVITPEKSPAAGQVRDVNTGMISALIRSEGGQVLTFPIIPDKLEEMDRVVKQAFSDADAVVISAGSSASTRDMTAEVIDQLGKPGVIVHGINIRPGKPTILAFCDGKPVIGLPGNPVSAMVIAQFFVRPMVGWMQGKRNDLPYSTIKARLEINLPSQSGREEWVPVNVCDSETGKVATPIFFKSNLIFQLAGADGLVRIPRYANGIFAGENVDVLLF
jgi:molybdopterin molybdotransferase